MSKKPNTSCAFRYSLGILVLGFMMSGSVFTQITKSFSTVARDEARRLWELAIKAKGGRELLYSVDSLLITSKGKRRTGSGRSYTQLRKTLVAKDKFWSYSDDGPSVFGITVSMANYESLIGYFGGKGGKIEARPIDISHPNEKHYKGYQNAILLNLMESRWLKPIVLESNADCLGSTKVYIIKTLADGRPTDFVIDQRNYRPIRITFYNTAADGKTYIVHNELSDYHDVAGIQVPASISCDGCGVSNDSYEFNVDYDPDIFVRPPDEITPDAWRKKK